MNKTNISDTIRKSDPDFYYEHLHDNKDKNFDMAKNKYTFKPEEVAKLKKSHDSLQEIKLKAWSKKYRENKKYTSDEFEYLL